MTRHIPDLNTIIDQLIARSEHTRDQDEHDVVIAMLRLAEDYAARQARIVALTEQALHPITTIGPDMAHLRSTRKAD